MRRPRMALCLEQTLGHRAHGKNLEAAVAAGEHAVEVVHVEYPEAARVRVPWAVRGSWLARQALRRRKPFDMTLFHTQSIALFAGQATRGRRYVVSLDATPRQVDAMGRWYRHRTLPAPIEAAKDAWYRHVLAGAAGVVAWSEWAAASLRDDYGVDRARMLVAHPGAGPAFFEIEHEQAERLPQILFVGGDFARKGGPDLLEAFARLRGRAELVLVTDAEVPPAEGVRVERGIQPGTARQLAAFAAADIFCLPTLGDCTSVAIGEAMAAGLPVVTTRVGSNEDTVADGETGLLVPGADPGALAVALETLVSSPSLRNRLGVNARAAARARMDAMANAGRILTFMEALA